VFPAPAEILAPRQGTIAETPLPLLLQAIFAEGRTVTLELTLRALVKRIGCEDGCPVACRSNLLHETLGKFLVERRKLTEEQYQEALRSSVATGKRMGELLVERKQLQPFELYKLMQANLALKILDAFRWSDATWRLVGESEAAELALRMNPAQLVLTGCAGFVPFDVVASQLAFPDDQRFALVAKPPHVLSDLKLSAKELKLANALRRRPTFDELMRDSGLDVEEAMRRLFAFAALGMVDFAEAVPAEAAPAEAATADAATAAAAAAATPGPPAPAPPPATPILTPAPGVPETEEDDPALRDALVTSYLEHRAQDPFDLLGVKEAAPAAELRRTFLALADRFAPLRFRSPDLKEKAEALLAARARAYGALADPEQAAQWRKRRAAAAERAKGATARPSTAEQFRISTELLDASTQYQEGLRRLAAGNARGALEQFQFAADIDPKPITRAHLAWTRYLVDPERAAKASLAELADVVRADAGCGRAHFFTGEILRARGAFGDAEEAYRRAFRADPNDRRSQELALEAMRQRKTQR
jgi:tetratricopeptide (TPR) repeat protein